jgi:L-iditol 2-dehydrogenase
VPPAVFGHEFAGTIEETQNQDWPEGERVVVANSAPCGSCSRCQGGQENLCEDLLFLNGAYAESIVVPGRIAFKNMLRLKPGTEFRDAALVEPLACVVQGVEDTQLRAGRHVLILGAGPIGLMFVALARHLGCEVTVAGRREARLSAAKRLGASRVVDIGDGTELVGQMGKLPSNQFDAVIEAVGKPEVWEAAVKLVRKGGVVNFFGGCPAGTSITLDTGLIHYSNLTLRASFHHTPRTIRRALAFIELGVVHSRDFVDGECALSQLPELFQRMAAGNQAVKTLVRVRE